MDETVTRMLERVGSLWSRAESETPGARRPRSGRHTRPPSTSPGRRRARLLGVAVWALVLAIAGTTPALGHLASDEGSPATAPAAPAAPEGVRALATTASSLTVAWSGPPGAELYRIEIANNPDMWDARSSWSRLEHAELSGLWPDRWYYVRVGVVDPESALPAGPASTVVELRTDGAPEVLCPPPVTGGDGPVPEAADPPAQPLAPSPSPEPQEPSESPSPTAAPVPSSAPTAPLPTPSTGSSTSEPDPSTAPSPSTSPTTPAASPTAAPSPTPTAAPGPVTTLWGANYAGSNEVDESLYLGRAQVARIFFQDLGANSWSANQGVQEATADGIDTFVISWKDRDPDDVRAFLATIPDGLTIYASFHHEPENDAGSPGSDTYRAWSAEWKRLWSVQSPIIRGEGFVPTAILMAYTLVPGSGRQLADWTPPEGTVDVLAFDAYLGRQDPVAQVERIVEAVESLGLSRTGIAETGAPLGQPDRAEKLATMRAEILAAGVFEWAIYWNASNPGYDSRMDPAAADAWFG